MSAEGLIENLLSTGEVFPPPDTVRAWAKIPDQDAWLTEIGKDPLGFWRAQGERIAWETPPTTTLEGGLGNAKWFVGGRLNATVSCLDRHVATHPDATAYLFIREDGLEQKITYKELLAATNRFANALAADGVKQGDRVVIYMPLTIEGIVAMLACARLGAVHSVVYAGLGATALRDRCDDAGAEVIIGADITYRRGKEVDLKTILNDAVSQAPKVRRVIVLRRSANKAPLTEKERDFAEYSAGQSSERAPAIVDANDPLFILYTSGTTGKPKGVIMTHGGYLAGASGELALTTGITPDDVYWCTSDIGWIVGHSLIVYGALANRYNSIIREGSPDFPHKGIVYELIEKYKVSMLYTAPTLARMLMRFGLDLLEKNDLSSLKAVYCAGEPLNPEAWHFLYETMCKKQSAVCNQWWQTETGCMMLGFLPTSAIHPDRSGKALGPARLDVVNRDGTPTPRNSGGLLVIRDPWPHMFAGIWGDPARYAQYFNELPGTYTAGDVATIDDNGYITVLGRSDDVLNVAGHRIATADIESALVSHHACGEAGVIGKPDALKGEVIKAFVILRQGFEPSDALRTEMIKHVRYTLGPIGEPADLEFVAKLPKTRSGKIMRRLLKAQETGQDVGDVTTLED
jgi:acetyl-CoA synthetase